MAGVGHEPPPGVLRGLQAVCQAVELRRDLGDLVGTAGVGAVAVRTLADAADGLQQAADLPRQHAGEGDAQSRHQQRDHHGDAQQVALKALQQRRLLRVVVVGVHRAHRLVVVHHRRGHTAEECLAVVLTVKCIAALQRRDDHRVQRVLAHGVVALPGVVQHHTGGVRHHDTGGARLVQAGQRHGDIFLRQLLQPHQRRLNDLGRAAEVGLVGGYHQILGHQQRVGVQQDQHRRDDQDVAEAEFELQRRLAPQLFVPRRQLVPYRFTPLADCLP